MIEARESTRQGPREVFVRSPRRSGLAKVLANLGATVFAEPCGGLSVVGMDACRIASAAAAHYIPIQELTPRAAHTRSCANRGSWGTGGSSIRGSRDRAARAGLR